MHHVGTITRTTKARSFNAQCSCGTAGDFITKDEAVGYLQGHFAKQGGISTSEIVDNSDKPQVPKVKPSAHVAGLGNMPTSHAALGANAPSVTAGPPPPPPAPPDAKKKSESEDKSAVK